MARTWESECMPVNGGNEDLTCGTTIYYGGNERWCEITNIVNRIITRHQMGVNIYHIIPIMRHISAEYVPLRMQQILGAANRNKFITVDYAHAPEIPTRAFAIIEYNDNVRYQQIRSLCPVDTSIWTLVDGNNYTYTTATYNACKPRLGHVMYIPHAKNNWINIPPQLSDEETVVASVGRSVVCTFFIVPRAFYALIVNLIRPVTPAHVIVEDQLDPYYWYTCFPGTYRIVFITNGKHPNGHLPDVGIFASANEFVHLILKFGSDDGAGGGGGGDGNSGDGNSGGGGGNNYSYSAKYLDKILV